MGIRPGSRPSRVCYTLRGRPTRTRRRLPTPTPEEIQRQREIVRQKSKVDYPLLARAKDAFTERFPDADEVRAGLYGAMVYVEVWDDGAAKIYPYDGE